jgi:hypothetical protein
LKTYGTSGAAARKSVSPIQPRPEAFSRRLKFR